MGLPGRFLRCTEFDELRLMHLKTGHTLTPGEAVKLHRLSDQERGAAQDRIPYRFVSEVNAATSLDSLSHVLSAIIKGGYLH